MDTRLHQLWGILEDSRRLRLELEEATLELSLTRMKVGRIQRKISALPFAGELFEVANNAGRQIRAGGRFSPRWPERRYPSLPVRSPS
jgi:hypothetical protein